MMITRRSMNEAAARLGLQIPNLPEKIDKKSAEWKRIEADLGARADELFKLAKFRDEIRGKPYIKPAPEVATEAASKAKKTWWQKVKALVGM